MIEQKIFKAALNSAGWRAASEHRGIFFFFFFKVSKERLKEGGGMLMCFPLRGFMVTH